MISDWLSHIASFTINYKKELDELVVIKDINREKWSELYTRVRTEFSSSLAGKDIKEIETSPWSNPGSLEIQAISEGEYKKESKDIYYGVKMSPFHPCGADLPLVTGH